MDSRLAGFVRQWTHPLTPIVVNAYPLTRIGLQISLERLGFPVEAIIVADPAMAKLAVEQTPGRALVILDIDPPNTLGMTMLLELASIRPDARIVILSGTHDPQSVCAAEELGAVGYISKLATVDAVSASLRNILNGVPSFERSTVEATITRSKSLSIERRVEATLPRLTRRQFEILQLVRNGMPNKAIARALNVSSSTVKVHISNILRAYNARNRTELVARTYDEDNEGEDLSSTYGEQSLAARDKPRFMRNAANLKSR